MKSSMFSTDCQGVLTGTFQSKPQREQSWDLGQLRLIWVWPWMSHTKGTHGLVMQALHPDGTGISGDRELMMDWPVKHHGTNTDSVQMLLCKAMEQPLDTSARITSGARAQQVSRKCHYGRSWSQWAIRDSHCVGGSLLWFLHCDSHAFK